MKWAGILGWLAFLVSGCTTPADQYARAHARTPQETQIPESQQHPQKAVVTPASKASEPEAPVQYTRPPTRPAPAPNLPANIHLPTLLHHQDQSIMVHVPAGSYLVPAENVSRFQLGPNTRLQHKNLPEFWIDRLEITVEQYKRFNPDYNEILYTGGTECPQCPAMAITWFNARRYCEWAGKRLPTEIEWEAAARGSSEWAFPWGDQWQGQSGNTAGDQDGFLNAAPAGSFPKGASPFGALDMIGNVWEWVGTPVVLPSLVETRPELKSNSLYPVKGGGWRSTPEMATVSYRNLADPNLSNPTFGFRCAKSEVAEHPQ